MSEKRVVLDTAAFIDSAHAVSVRGAPTADIREIVQRFVACCYHDVGVAPHLLDGDDLAAILRVHLPRRFGVGDPLAEAAAEAIGAFLGYTRENEFVPAALELRNALGEHAEAFAEIVASGAAHRDGIAHPDKGETIQHHADKVGRNDPCPCGSGKKFKKCCMGTGGNP